MGAAASGGVKVAIRGASPEDLQKAIADLSLENLQKLKDALNEGTAQCYCGACKVSVTGEPDLQLMCHCDDCRRWGGSIVQAAKLYPPEKVAVTGDLICKDEGKEGRKSCAKCGGLVVIDKSDTIKKVIVPAGLFNTPFEPAMHIQCKEQICCIKDGLTKYMDFPKDFGGSDEKVDDAFEPEAKEPESMVQCYCGTCKVTCMGEPAMQFFCHCDDCRRWSGSLAVAAKMFPADNVKIEGDLVCKDEAWKEGLKGMRKSCKKCGGAVANDLSNSMKMVMVPAGLFNSPFKPTMHVKYASRVWSFKDGLPKFKDWPAGFGGSDEKMDE